LPQRRHLFAVLNAAKMILDAAKKNQNALVFSGIMFIFAAKSL
jgi:hypothetical protein